MVDHLEPDAEPDPDDTPVQRPDDAVERSWLDDPYPLVDADFVGSTLDRVLHDRDEIESEAACVEQIRFDDDFLANYTTPEASDAFVADTLTRVLADRAAGRNLQTDSDYEFHALMEQSQIPEPGVEFVERTLRAVLRDRELHASAPLPSRFRNRFSVVASIAAIALCTIVIFWKSEVLPTLTRPLAAPVAWASLLPEADDTDRDFVIRPPVQNPILAFASAATADQERNK